MDPAKKALIPIKANSDKSKSVLNKRLTIKPNVTPKKTPINNWSSDDDFRLLIENL